MRAGAALPRPAGPLPRAAVRRAAAAGRDRDRAGPAGRGAARRRADQRAGRDGPGGGAGTAPRTARARGHVGPVDQPRPRGGGRAVRPGGDHAGRAGSSSRARRPGCCPPRSTRYTADLLAAVPRITAAGARDHPADGPDGTARRHGPGRAAASPPPEQPELASPLLDISGPVGAVRPGPRGGRGEPATGRRARSASAWSGRAAPARRRSAGRCSGWPGSAAGQIRFDGTDIAGLRGRALQDYRRAAQIVFQDPDNSLDPRMRVGTSIAGGAGRAPDGAAPAVGRAGRGPAGRGRAGPGLRVPVPAPAVRRAAPARRHRPGAQRAAAAAGAGRADQRPGRAGAGGGC